MRSDISGGTFTTDGKGKLDDPTCKRWYHGSPTPIVTLAEGSSITRNRKLAVAFSYKPSQISVSDEGEISHNGTRRGYLYEVTERVAPEDIDVHPSCLPTDPWEWVTRKPLKLKVVEDMGH